MADHLASIFGTEKDKVNCPFYHKVGACRHGERCSRKHNPPAISETILIPNMYQNPLATPAKDSEQKAVEYDPEYLEEHFEGFYEDVFLELMKFGEILELYVCDNLTDHLMGNVYARFAEEEAAQQAVAALSNRYYGGRPLRVEFSPVTDFREARCRKWSKNECDRGTFCNFLHLKKPSRSLQRSLKRLQESKYGPSKRSHSRSRSRSRSPSDRYHGRSSSHGHHRHHRSHHREHHEDDRDDREHRRYRDGDEAKVDGEHERHRSHHHHHREHRHRSHSRGLEGGEVSAPAPDTGGMDRRRRRDYDGYAEERDTHQRHDEREEHPRNEKGEEFDRSSPKRRKEEEF
eukprot:TRINITY_DN1073_c0_g1_i2.p1 TRINITY_DN1073_c0_g1~~TRINITY_DN1073_c0_g1_i2.p1  ORF type:complete len:346 (-),score=70.20 TRINITY_DN1073_c0_g1_i2:1470-2507(-)